MLHQDGTHPADKGNKRPHAQIDLRGNNNHHHADSKYDHISILLDKGYERVGLEEHASRKDLEGNDDNNKCADNTVLAQVARNRCYKRLLLSLRMLPASPIGLRCIAPLFHIDICGAHWETPFLSFSFVINFIRYS